jgi:hypothetical protein
MIKLYFDSEMDKRIEYSRNKGNAHKGPEGVKGYVFTESEFCHYLFILGLLQYESEILPKQTGEPYKPYYFIKGDEVYCRSDAVQGETA